jgi:L-amino acid N-acyltransferase YncA
VVRVREARLEDAAVITAIYNLGIAGRLATFETEPRSVADIEQRLSALAEHPLVVAEGEGAGVVGWAGAAEYRPRACYSGIGEFSVYVAPDWRGRGVGRGLVEGLVAAAADRGYWKLLSRVFPDNTASRALCRATGFREVGMYERHGFLDGRWRDVVIVERLIEANLPGSGVVVRAARRADWPAIRALLEADGLPIEGAEAHLGDFLVAVRRDQVVGTAGLECYPSDAVLLRSVAVAAAERGTGAGRRLVERVLERAARRGARHAVLLTTSAQAFFTHLGFVPVCRDDVPRALHASAEFRGACPATAAVMIKDL